MLILIFSAQIGTDDLDGKLIQHFMDNLQCFEAGGVHF
jgi:hypothetical protein